ncbi:MAG: sn-glycerol-3-phosphate ABC transporter ATP-binding protein UgpC [Anaerolineales bacterium]|nr:MAG: sn-glycerol-3-phosphate ABC transporter ATP-binding protein UgpC [Chloroflexota bacterium]MBE7434621.1 sn-glycerol-3-phosphate ABC transporter ATP-binding protein UgpC [Anaerolineales bacterium]MCK6583649.1 sn-glycerol-3-phosphate ABC transporter ATP-binding protein UgpC [Anaerolineales bacterium]
MATLELINIHKKFGDFVAVEDVNLRVEEGEFVTLLGPSGCGKSTLLNMTAGLEDVTSGEIRINGKVVNQLGPFERDVAMVFQNYALYPHMTVEENIGFSLQLRKRPRTEIQDKVQKVAAMLELEKFLHRLPRELSGGQQQRVAIGRAVIREPSIFLFDEPFSNLDAALRLKTRGEIKELHQRLGVTSVFVTHDQEEALSLSDRIAVLRMGHLEQFGTPEEIYSKPATKYVARFIGSPQMDMFAGEFTDGRRAYHIGSAKVALSKPTQAPNTPVDVGVRAEFVTLGEKGFNAVIRLVQPVGPFTYVTVDWDGGSVTARVNGVSHLKPKENIKVDIDPEGLLFFDRTSEKRIDL